MKQWGNRKGRKHRRNQRRGNAQAPTLRRYAPLYCPAQNDWKPAMRVTDANGNVSYVPQPARRRA